MNEEPMNREFTEEELRKENAACVRQILEDRRATQLACSHTHLSGFSRAVFVRPGASMREVKAPPNHRERFILVPQDALDVEAGCYLLCQLCQAKIYKDTPKRLDPEGIYNTVLFEKLQAAPQPDISWGDWDTVPRVGVLTRIYNRVRGRVPEPLYAPSDFTL